MKSHNKIKYTILSATLFAFGLAGCASVSNDSVEPINETDLEAASEIIGETLSSDNSGAMSSMYDALSNISASGISYGDLVLTKQNEERDERSGRGRESNFSYSYDSQTGTHTVDFNRAVSYTDNQGGEYSRSLSAHLKYIFLDLDDEFIAFPRWRNSAIETIDFVSERNGESITPYLDTEFTRIDTLLFTGIHSSSAVFGVNGVHYGSGSVKGTLRDNTPIDRAYSVRIEFDDVQIEKDTVLTNGNLEEGISGTLIYEITYTNEDGEEETLEGEILLEENGEALLRFNGFSQVFRLSLRDGQRVVRNGNRNS